MATTFEMRGGHQLTTTTTRTSDQATYAHADMQQRDEGDDPVPGRFTVVLTASSVVFIGLGITNTFGVFQEYYIEHTLKHEKPEKIIVIGSTAASLYFVLGAFAGRFADLIGYRPSLLLGASLMVGSLFAASAATTYIQLLLSQGIGFGLGLSFAYLPAVSVSRQYWRRNHGVANAVVVSGGAVGGAILPYIVKLLLAEKGPSQTFRILGYVAAAGLLPSIIFLRPSKPTVPLWRRQAIEGRRPPLLDLSLLSNSKFNALLLASTIAMFGFLPRYFLLVDSAVTQGVNPSFTPWLLGLMNGLSIVGRIGIGYYADRFGKVSALSLSFMLCGLGHLTFWLSGVLLPTTDQNAVTAMFKLFVIYIGVFGSGFISLFPVVMAHLFGGEALASKQGLLNTIVGLATLTGPSAVYAIVGDGETHRWAIAIVSAGLFMAVGGFLLFVLLSRPAKLVSRLGDISRREA